MDADARHAAQYLDLRTPLPDKADLIFVFGTRHAKPAHVAARLFEQGVAGYVVVTGGVNRGTGLNEAEAHREVLLEDGVPADRIIVEPASTNTLENVVFALPRIAEVMALDSIQSMVVVAKWFHARRATMTLKRHLPDGIRYFVESWKPPDVLRRDWWQHADARAHVMREMESIPLYLEKGDIAEIQARDGCFV